MSDKGDAAPAAAPIETDTEPFPTFDNDSRFSIDTTTSDTAASSSAPVTHSAAITSLPGRRGRARTTTLIAPENPCENPINAEEQALANLANRINRENRRSASLSQAQQYPPNPGPSLVKPASGANPRASTSQGSGQQFPLSCFGTNLVNRANCGASASQGPALPPSSHFGLNLANRANRRASVSQGSGPPFSYIPPLPARSTSPVREEGEGEGDTDDETTPRATTPVSIPIPTPEFRTPFRDQAGPSPASEIPQVFTPIAALEETVISEISTTPVHNPVATPEDKTPTRDYAALSEASETHHEASASAVDSSSSSPIAPRPTIAAQQVVASQRSAAIERPAPVYIPPGTPAFEYNPKARFVVLPNYTAIAFRAIMQPYSNYLDSPGAGPNPRQAPPSPSQGMHQNGVNGGMGMTGGMVGFPTPAGHQSDLNYIMQMVEELAGQLAHNQGLTAGLVDKMGRIRSQAKNLDLSNDEVLALAASELNITSENIEKENSELRKALEKTLIEKKENWKLAIHGANILSDILDKMHTFKSQHEADTLAWHRNYRKQLADEREENQNLRDQIADMKAAASRANDHLRQMRRFVTDHDELHALRIENVSLRQQRRLWKRKALPLIPADDSEWSDDDDVVDPEEKKRKVAEEVEKDRKDREGGEEGGDAPGA